MATSQPLVSVIIPTKDRADLLERALSSVFSQTHENIEVIVVNDGSSDRTSEVLSRIKDQADVKVLIIENDFSVGAAQARNQAIKAASGEFVAGLDDDDKWHEDRVKELVAAYSDEFACITSDTIMVFADYKARWKKRKVIDLDRLLFTNQVGNQVLVRRDRLVEAGGFDTDLVAAQDYDLWVRLCAAYGPIKNVQKPLQTVFMDHQSERITDRSSFQGYLQFYQKHKHRMSRQQRKYKLFNIRRAQGKPLSFYEFLSCVPLFRYWKEIKRIIISRFSDVN